LLLVLHWSLLLVAHLLLLLLLLWWDHTLLRTSVVHPR